jgi:A/G-specific adenine glycosylase
VWVAEIMAQQTRLEAMLPYYRHWMRRFPTLRSLADSKEQDVLAMWEGLGYYSRARNLRKAAQLVAAEHKGKLPNTVEGLLALPGIGRYTAGAIASLAFGVDAAAVDGNAIRVLSRVFDVREPMNSSVAQKRYWELAEEHLPRGRAAAYNQALMDLGAQVCTPRQPKCNACPLRAECAAYALGVQEQRPVKSKAAKNPLRRYAAAIVRNNDKVLVIQRPERGLLAGMWEFPNVELGEGKRVKIVLQRDLKSRFGIKETIGLRIGEYEHVYSHFDAHLQAFEVSLNGSASKLQIDRPHRWVSMRKLAELPMGKLDRSVANTLRMK